MSVMFKNLHLLGSLKIELLEQAVSYIVIGV